MQNLRSVSFLVFFFVAGLLYAQPSGGPYGPIDQLYEIPNAAHVYFVAPDGSADAAGTELAHPTTIEAAIARVVTGDAIVMRGGLYRTGGLVLNQGITIQPYEEEHPVFKGTEIATAMGGFAQPRLANQMVSSLSGRAAALVESRA